MKRTADRFQNSRATRVFCCSDYARCPRDIESRKCRHGSRREITGFVFGSSISFEQSFGAFCSSLCSVVGETLDFIKIETDSSGREVYLLQTPLLHQKSERRARASKNRACFPGVDKMTAGVRPLAASKDAFCLFVGDGGIGLQ